MVSINHLFPPHDVLLDADVSDAPGLFLAVGKLWQAHHSSDAELVMRCLAAREDLGSTALGQGVAIPHARTDELGKTLSAFIRTAKPIQFDAPDGMPVDCFVLLLVPGALAQQHLQLLGDVAKRLANAKCREQLRAAKSSEEINALFAESWNEPVGRARWVASK